MFYEIIYETGDHSIASYDSDDEAIGAIAEHHSRAKKGLKAQATNDQMGPAIRIIKVLKYDQHPADFNLTGTVEIDALTTAVDEAIRKHAVGDQVSVNQIAAEIRDIADPVITDSAPHDSNYKMTESDRLDISRWDTSV
jgi:hypothetical protein